MDKKSLFIISLMLQLRRRAIERNYWGSFFALLAFVFANVTLVVIHLFFHGLILAIIFSNNVEQQGVRNVENKSLQ